MIKFEFNPISMLGSNTFTPIKLEINCRNDVGMEDLVMYFKAFLLSMSFFPSQIDDIKYLDYDEIDPPIEPIEEGDTLFPSFSSSSSLPIGGEEAETKDE